MKKSVLFFSSFLASTALIAQSLVSTAPEPRKAVIEEITAIKCGYCPAGHDISDDLISTNPGEVISLRHHAGTLANPSSGQPDFRTSHGIPIAQFSGATGTPMAMVNREEYTGGKLAMSRSNWQPAAEGIITSGEDSPVNIGISSSFDPSTRELAVEVELYYTSSESGTNKVTVALTESGLTGYQSDYSNGTQYNYTHNYVVRDIITSDTWGDEVSNTSQGSLVKKSYSYTVDNGWDISNCNVVAYVSQSDDEKILTGREVAADGGTTLGLYEEELLSDWSIYPNPMSEQASMNFSLLNSAEVQYEVYNLLGEKVWEENLGTISAGQQYVQFDNSQAALAEGMYVLRLQVGDQYYSKNLLVQ